MHWKIARVRRCRDKLTVFSVTNFARQILDVLVVITLLYVQLRQLHLGQQFCIICQHHYVDAV